MPGLGRRRAPTKPTATDLPGISVLKPLCGAEPRLFDNLSTFCRQDYPDYQLVFGVASPTDPAIEVVHALQRAYPAVDITLVIDPAMHGGNRKVSNLINILARTRHDLLVLADSDIGVERDYLRVVTAPLADPANGIVTCLYSGRPVAGFWSRVGALFVDEWFAPSVRVAHMGGTRDFGFGSTLALRRETLERAGGLGAIKDRLADDYWLAANTRSLGLRTVLAPIIVDTDVTETSLAALWQHETRWLRTIRSVNSAGFGSLCITFCTPWLLLGVLLWFATHSTYPLLASLAAGITLLGAMARLGVHARATAHTGTFWKDLPLVPLRDILLALEWLSAVSGTHVMWRGARVAVDDPVDNRTLSPTSSEHS
jgi:ceramide glucosyltransferase